MALKIRVLDRTIVGGKLHAKNAVLEVGKTIPSKEANHLLDNELAIEHSEDSAATGNVRLELLKHTRDELVAIATEKKLEIATNANKAAIANAILQASGYSLTPEEIAEGK